MLFATHLPLEALGKFELLTFRQVHKGPIAHLLADLELLGPHRLRNLPCEVVDAFLGGRALRGADFDGARLDLATSVESLYLLQLLEIGRVA